MNRRHLLKLIAASAVRVSRRSALLRRAGHERAPAGGFPARRLRRGQPAGAGVEQLLLRGAAQHRHCRSPAPPPNAALALDADWAPASGAAQLAAAAVPERQLAFVPFAGTDDVSRSHFETQDTIELGQAHDARRNYHSGFMNRLAGVLGERPRPIGLHRPAAARLARRAAGAQHRAAPAAQAGDRCARRPR